MNTPHPYVTRPDELPEVEEETLLDLESEEAVVGPGCPINPEDREGCEACQ